MNRVEFIKQLADCLSALSEDEREAALSYYEEFFDDAGPENEQSVIKNLGSPKEIAEQIMSDSTINEERGLVLKPDFGHRDKSSENANTSAGSQSGNTEKHQHTENKDAYYNDNTASAKPDTPSKDYTGLIIGIIILVLTSPIWGGILIGILSVIFSILVAIASIVFAAGITGIVLFFVGIVYLFITPAAGLVMLGISFILLGITMLVFIPIIKFFVWLAKITFKGCKSLFNTITGKKRSEA